MIKQEKIDNVKALLAQGLSYRNISETLHVSRYLVRNIAEGIIVKERPKDSCPFCGAPLPCFECPRRMLEARKGVLQEPDRAEDALELEFAPETALAVQELRRENPSLGLPSHGHRGPVRNFSKRSTCKPLNTSPKEAM